MQSFLLVMSRGVKDLRDLVVVSRLTYRCSDSESDDGRAGLITPFESLDITDRHAETATPTPPSSADSGIGRRKKKRKRPKGYRSSKLPESSQVLSYHEFPKPKPLPAVGAHFQQFSDRSQSTESSSEHLTGHRDKIDVHYSRLLESINLGYTEVVHYFLYSGKLSAGYVDCRQKTLLHIATAANQPRVVEYLLKKWTGCMDVNRPCDTGNSPLHVAVNLGNYNLIQLLLNMPDIQVDRENSQCDGATPLHLAILHGSADTVRMLLKAKANPNKLMAGQSAIAMADEFGHSHITAILCELT
ncbi:FAM220A [Bugula neritina]|uniref:FAM220A n=1 Tax=Bugula neritina TaxID=10212 RepID=A0A7J7K2N4_BUGNE|nr:FAM220A [Bugula neritina]